MTPQEHRATHEHEHTSFYRSSLLGVTDAWHAAVLEQPWTLYKAFRVLGPYGPLVPWLRASGLLPPLLRSLISIVVPGSLAAGLQAFAAFKRVPGCLAVVGPL